MGATVDGMKIVENIAMFVSLKGNFTMRFANGVLGILFAAAFLLPCSEAKGQLYFTGAVGAGVGASSTKSVRTLGNFSATIIKPETSGLAEFYPEAGGGLRASLSLNVGAGYMITEKFGVGASLGYHMVRQGTSKKLIANDFKSVEHSNTTVNAFTLRPYLRVVPLSVAGFSVYFDCGVPMEFGAASSSVKTEEDGTKSESKDKLGNVILAGVGLTPGVMYSFTDHISLFASIKFLNIGYTYTQFTPDTAVSSSNIKTTERYHQFNLGKLSEGMEIGLRIAL